MVFPLAVFFAEAKDTKIYGLPYNQFVIPKMEQGFEFIDLTNGRFKNTEMRLPFINPKGNN